MSSQNDLHLIDQPVAIDERAPGEWIAHAPAGGRSLHVYRVALADWLVSEVGQGNEGRGTDLPGALAALAAGAPPPEWWSAVALALCP
jgi:hypothetical protein